jgi:hypothetical protein
MGPLMATVSLYTPDKSPKPRFTPEATPTRSSGGMSSLTGSMNQISLHTPQGPPFMGSMLPTYSNGYGAPGCGPLVVGGSVYSPYSPNAMSPLGGQQYPNSLNQQMFGPPSSFSPYHNSSMGMSPRPQYGLNRNYGSNHGQYQHDMFYSPTHANHSNYGGRQYSRPSPSRELVRRGYHFRHHSREHASGPHNHVDVGKIQAGSDVRTTVSTSSLLGQLCLLIIGRSCLGISPTRSISRSSRRSLTCQALVDMTSCISELTSLTSASMYYGSTDLVLC